MMSAAFIGRLTIVGMLLFQSPFMTTKTGQALSPISVVTKFIVENAKSAGDGELSDQAKNIIRTINWPSQMVEECVMSHLKGVEGNCDPTFVWQSAIAYAMKGTTFWDNLPETSRQMLFAGCSSTLFGAVISFAMGRTHLLAVLGPGLLGYGAYVSKLTPTFQYALCIIIALLGIRSRASTMQPLAPAAKKNK